MGPDPPGPKKNRLFDVHYHFIKATCKYFAKVAAGIIFTNNNSLWHKMYNTPTWNAVSRLMGHPKIQKRMILTTLIVAFFEIFGIFGLFSSGV